MANQLAQNYIVTNLRNVEFVKFNHNCFGCSISDEKLSLKHEKLSQSMPHKHNGGL